jgi:hypothetical protein
MFNATINSLRLTEAMDFYAPNGRQSSLLGVIARSVDSLFFRPCWSGSVEFDKLRHHLSSYRFHQISFT